MLADDTGFFPEFARKCREKQDFIFKPVVFYTLGELLEFHNEYAIDLLLCSDKAESPSFYDFENICFLCEQSEVRESEENIEKKRRYIFKYQPADEIIREIMDFYSHTRIKEEDDIAAIEADKRVICVCSPMGGCYSSTFALALAAYYSKGAKTLFISFDPFFFIPGDEKRDTDRNLSDLVYYVEETKIGVADRIAASVKHRGNLDYVSGVTHWFDISDISRDTVRSLLDALKRSTEYEYIVFDIGTMGRSSIELLAGAKTVYLPARRGRQSEKIVTEWKKQVCFADHSDIIEKTKVLEIPYDEQLEGEYSLDVLLKGHLGQYIEKTEGLRYCR